MILNEIICKDIETAEPQNLNRDQVFDFQILLCSYPDQWCGVWHVFAASQALKINIKQVYPFDQSFYDKATDHRRSMLQFMNSTFKSNDSQGKNNF